MSIVHIKIDEKDIVAHKTKPELNTVPHAIPINMMAEFHWIKVVALGYGKESAENRDSTEAAFNELNQASRLFLSSGNDFSILCEKKTDTENIIFAIGCEDRNIADSLLGASFGSVKTMPYTPSNEWKNCYYATSFERLRVDVDSLDNRNNDKDLQPAHWIDEVALILAHFPGMVRIDFHALQEEERRSIGKTVEALNRNQDEISDELV